MQAYRNSCNVSLNTCVHAHVKQFKNAHTQTEQAVDFMPDFYYFIVTSCRVIFIVPALISKRNIY